MNTAAMRQQLHNYLKVADDKKVMAIYTMVEDEIREQTITYTEEFQAESDCRVAYYLTGGKMVTPAQMSKRLQAIRKKRKEKPREQMRRLIVYLFSSRNNSSSGASSRI